MNRTKMVATAFSALALAVGVAACGSDDEETTDASEETASATEVTVTADDISATEKTFELSATPTEKTESVTFTNDGDEEHVLIFAKISEGFTTEEAIELQGEKGSTTDILMQALPPGESAKQKVKGDITPGSYVMLCPIGSKDGPHFELGQLEEFEVQ